MVALTLSIIIIGVVVWFWWNTKPTHQKRYNDKMIKNMNEYIEKQQVEKYGKDEWEKRKKQIDEKNKDVFKNFDSYKFEKALGLEPKKKYTKKNIAIIILFIASMIFFVYKLISGIIK